MYITREMLNYYNTTDVYTWGIGLIKDPQKLNDFIELTRKRDPSSMNEAYDIVYAAMVNNSLTNLS